MTQPERERVPGVDDQRVAGVEVHAQQLPGDELAHRRMRDQRFVGVPRLLAEVSTSTTFVAKASHQQGREQRGRDLVTGSVGDRNLQRITVQAVVEGVSADGAGRFEPAGDGELPRLTGVGARQQPPLDLRGQCEVRRALTPSNRSVCRRFATTT